MSTTVFPVTIETQYVNNTELFRRLLKIRELTISPAGVRKHISFEKLPRAVTFELKAEKPMNLSISPFDLAMMDAIYTLMVAGTDVFTPAQIYQVMSGDPNQRVSAAMQDKISTHMDVLSGLSIQIDAGKQFSEYKRLKEKSAVFSGPFLPAEKVDGRHINRTACTAYRITEIPPIYQYAAALRQIVSIPAEWFNTKDYFNDTEDAVVIKRYVLKRIKLILSNNQLCSRRIALEHDRCNFNYDAAGGLFSELGYRPDDSARWRKKTKPAVLRIVTGTLDHLVDLEVIDAYQPYRAGKTASRKVPVIGFEISIYIRDIARRNQYFSRRNWRYRT